MNGDKAILQIQMANGKKNYIQYISLIFAHQFYHSGTNWGHMCESVTSWQADLPPCPLAQASHQVVGCCQGCWEGCCHDSAGGHSLVQCQMHSEWPTGHKFAAPCPPPPAGNAAHCTLPSAVTSAYDERVALPASHAPLKHEEEKKEVSSREKHMKPKRRTWFVDLLFWTLPFWQVMIFLWSW